MDHRYAWVPKDFEKVSEKFDMTWRNVIRYDIHATKAAN